MNEQQPSPIERWMRWDPLGAMVDQAIQTLRRLLRHTWFRVVVFGFLGIVIVLLFSGVLGDVYRFIFERFPGRQWTYEMRDAPILYLGPVFLVVLFMVFTFFGSDRWLGGSIVLAAFALGFLGGHVFWGTDGPGTSWCFNSRFEVSVQPHSRLIVPAEADDAVIAFSVIIQPREDQERSSFRVEPEDLLSAIDAGGGSIESVEALWTNDSPFVRTFVVRLGNHLEQSVSGQIEISESGAEEGEDRNCMLHEPYEIAVSDER